MNPNTEQWYSRGYLPHLDSSEHLQSITFRLADSLPRKVLKELEDEFKKHLKRTIEYIDMNPVKAGLCQKPGDWRWSSAWIHEK